jgi:hypothetical protein
MELNIPNYSIRKFILSCNHFQGFTTNINIEEVNNLTVENLINIVKKNLKDNLQKNNFVALLEIFNRKDFHVHDETIESILNKNNEDIIYICTHQ